MSQASHADSAAKVRADRWIGRAVPRREDPKLLAGAGSFVDDLEPAGTAHACFTRSTHPFARVISVDVEPALAMPGVVAAYSAADFASLGGLRSVLDRADYILTEMPLLAGDLVRYVGEPVAVVLADDPYQAEDAAEAIVVEYSPLPPITNMAQALSPGASAIHPEAATNVLLDVAAFEDGDLESIFKTAPLVMDCEFGSGRLCASPLEGRSCLADWDHRTDQLVLRSSTQVPHVLRGSLARILGLPENAVRVIAPDVGGGFGQKCAISREEVIAAALAQRLRRPVKWTQDRRENLIADHHGHEQQYQVRAAFSSEGNLLGVEADILCDVGAYSSYPFSCGIEPMMAAKDMPGVYKLPHYAARSRAVVTNKAPMAAYRGVSRPQIVLVMERLMDKAARRLGLDRLEIRRRNLIRREDFPYTGITGLVYEEGSYLECLEACAKALQYDSWPERQAALSTEEWSWGLGLSCFSEYAAYGTTAFSQRKMTMTPGYDLATVEMDPTGAVTVAVGTVSQGQGHATTLAQIAADELGVPVERIRVRQGDTDVVPFGWGTFASRVAVTSGGAVQRAAAKLALQLKEIAAELLEVAPEDIVVHEGRLSVAGSSSASVPIEELARTAYYFSHKLPSGMDAGLSARASFDPYGTFSNATHGAIVKVHLATGQILIDRYVVAEDCGVMINPMIVEGQVRGGVTQGVAAALYEQMVYGDDGQPLTGSFMDYLLATINEAPPIEIVHLETPCPGSATGAKGMGEGGVIGAPAAIVNAVDDALMRLGIEFDSIPITPQMIVQSLQALRGGR